MNTTPSGDGPLNGVRILDLTSVLMGPFATQQLGDMGADVIKVESPAGDSTRDIGPMRHAGMGPAFLHCNRNKRSIVLNLKRTEGREALLRLAATADVLVYNLRPAAMKRLGLGYEDVAIVKSDIIYAGLYGFGQDGPYAARPAYDDLIQGAIGIPTLSVAAGGETPRYTPLTLADRTVGIAAVNAILAALFHRQRTGNGQSVEVPMFETMAQLTLGDHLGGATFDPPIGPVGYSRILNPNRKPYRTRDGYICAMFYNDRQWQAFFEMTGRGDLLQRDRRFSTIGMRTDNIHELYAMVAEAMATRTTAEWAQALMDADIPNMPMNTIESLMNDPHLAAVGFFEHQVHPTEGAIRTMRPATRFSRTQTRQRSFAPRLGENSEEVLREAGYGMAEIAALRASGVLDPAS